ncbi:tetratricopeptide repeat protein [Streptomyces sp. M19]
MHRALALCARTGNSNTEVWTRGSLGFLCVRLRRNQEAEGHLRQALGLARSIGDRHPESVALLGLALAALNQGDLETCEETARRTLALAQEIANPHGETWAMITLGLAHCFGGRHQEGTDWHRRALALARRLGEPTRRPWPSTASATGTPTWPVTRRPSGTCAPRSPAVSASWTGTARPRHSTTWPIC